MFFYSGVHMFLSVYRLSLNRGWKLQNCLSGNVLAGASLAQVLRGSNLWQSATRDNCPDRRFSLRQANYFTWQTRGWIRAECVWLEYEAFLSLLDHVWLCVQLRVHTLCACKRNIVFLPPARSETGCYRLPHKNNNVSVFSPRCAQVGLSAPHCSVFLKGLEPWSCTLKYWIMAFRQSSVVLTDLSLPWFNFGSLQ